jgi:hypothetical protein
MAVVLTWSDPNSIEEGYKIYRSLTPIDTEDLPAPLAVLEPNATSYADNNVVPATTYYYLVSAYISDIERVVSATITTGVDPILPSKIMQSVDEVDKGLNNNILLSGDAQSGSDLLLA